MKVAVIGANGQLGKDICQAFLENQDEVVELNHDQLDICDQENTFKILNKLSPQFVVNTAAMHNVEQCEANPAISFAVNGIGARNLAIASKDLGFTIMHISTDYVFDGAKQAPYVESDCPNPLNVYGNTKLSGEMFIKAIAEKYFILRISAIYGENLCRAKGGLNFVTLMLKLSQERDEVRVVNNEIVSPTYTMDIARQIIHMAFSSKYGTFHATSQGFCSWYEFAKEIFKLTNSTITLNVAKPDEFPAKVARPTYTVLENNNLKESGLDIMPHWKDSLENYLTILGEI